MRGGKRKKEKRKKRVEEKKEKINKRESYSQLELEVIISIRLPVSVVYIPL